MADDEKTFHFHHWLIIAALALLLIAISIENPFFELTDGHSVVFSAKSLSSLLKEVAFALIIAWVISMGIERQSRSRDTRNAELMRKAIAEDVFRGVFSKILPKTYVDLVIDSNLKRNIIRDTLRVNYEISELTPDEQKEIGTDKIAVMATYYFMLSNVSNDVVQEHVEYEFQNIPDRLENQFGIISLASGERHFNNREISKLHSKTSTGRSRYNWNMSIENGKPTVVQVKTRLIKQRSDSEILVSYYPTLAVEVSLSSLIEGMTLQFEDRTCSGSTLIYRAANGGGHWTLDGPMLPNESFVVWWMEEEPEAG